MKSLCMLYSPTDTTNISVMETQITLAPPQMGRTGLIYFNGSCSPEGLWRFVAPLHRLTGFCSLLPCRTPALTAHFGTQQNVQEVQMSLLLDLFKFPFIFKGLLSLMDHFVWGRKS